ncbi:cell division protein FtsN [Kibdelosporangium banguiense]|uniref:Cell division protein FtsN n=1 Tax=Kibdelosporangium banguiense TaxID=1365924 RepID=A0ABS4TDV1_9PSEU|nr:hypothetical protein [Kibdelosporangium banguiense]MBP2322519.1 cell division protein FtsN [Kibdelosporangium banguiense]
MFDETSPETRQALALYEDAIAQYDARTAAIGEEFARELAVADKAAAQRDKEQSEQLAEILANEKAEQQQQAAQQQNQWTAPREKETTISFGEFDDEQKSWSTPTPPMGLPPIPPIPEPIPEPLRPAAPEPMMTFGQLEDDETPPPAPPPPPKPGRRRLQEDDEDMSGQTWMS